MLAYLPDHRPGRAAARGARRLGVRDGRDARGPATHLARRRPVRAPRPPHGRAHGVPHPRRLLAPGGVNFLDLVVIASPSGGLARVPDGLPRGVLSWAGLALGSCVAIAVRRRRRRRARRARHRARGCWRRSRSWSSWPRSPGDRRSRRRPRCDGASADAVPARCARAIGSPARVVGVVGILVVVWLLIPAFANSPGWPARAVRDCAVARAHRPRRARATRRSPRRSVASSATRRSPRCSTRSRRPTPASPPADGIPAEAATRGHPSTREGRGRGVRPDPGGHRLRRRRQPRRHQRARRRGGARHACRHARRPPPRRPRSSRSTRTAISRCCGCPGSRCPRSTLGEGHVDERGALFGHPGGGDLRQAPDAHRRADRRPRHRHHPQRPDRARGVRARRGHRAGRLRRRPSSTSTAGSSA